MRYLNECIQILSRFASEIGIRVSLIRDLNFHSVNSNDLDDKQFTLLNSLYYMIVIDASSFLSEYDECFGVKTEEEYKERIDIAKQINKPLISKIREWKNLKDLRNELLAHNLRKGKNGAYILGIENIDYNAPRTLTDVYLLSNLIQFSRDTILSEFDQEIKNVGVSNLAEPIPPAKTLSKNDVSRITDELLTQVNEIKKRHGRKYAFHISDPIY